MKYTIRENIPACDIKKYLPPQFVGVFCNISHSTEAANLIVFHADRKTVVTGRFAEKALARIADKTLVTYCFGSEFSVEAQDIISENNGRAYALFGSIEWRDDSYFRFKNGDI